MKTYVHFQIAILSILGTTSAAYAREVDPQNDGWIAHANGNQLEICYRAAPPTAGQTLQILRSSFITPNKGPVREQFSPGGTARVSAALTSEGCLVAELVNGTAMRSDHARVLAETPLR